MGLATLAHATPALGQSRRLNARPTASSLSRLPDNTEAGPDFPFGPTGDMAVTVTIVSKQTLCQNHWMQIREAIPEDAPAACNVLKRSIAELCEADHRNDPSILARWLGNKTHENFCAWVKQPDNSILVAVENEDILAVGSVTDTGMIGLNYVSPDARFRGVSRALLRALEIRAAERGNSQCNLTSTETARRFYLSNGYVETGPPVGGFGTSSGYPMTKTLPTSVEKT